MPGQEKHPQNEDILEFRPLNIFIKQYSKSFENIIFATRFWKLKKENYLFFQCSNPVF